MDAIRPKVGPAPSDATTRDLQASVKSRLGANLALPLPASSVSEAAATLESLHIDARSHLTQAMQLDPSAVRPRVLLFLLDLRDQRFAEAEQLIGALVGEHPLEPDYLAHYAELRLRTVELPKAKDLAERALRIDPKHLDAQRIKTVLDVALGERADSDQPSPERRLATVIERSPETAKVLLTLFQNLTAHHHLAEATRLGNALLALEPQNAALRNALVDLRLFAHPLGAPLYQLRRAGWVGFAILGVALVAFYNLLAARSDALATTFLVACLLVGGGIGLLPALMRR